MFTWSKRLKTSSKRGPDGKTSTQVTVCATVVGAEEIKKKGMDSHEKKRNANNSL